MPFSHHAVTRHTDTYAATGFVHAGVLLALTELAYAAYESAAGIAKPAHIVSVQTRTRAEYLSPLPWRDNAVLEVTTTDAHEHGFVQTFAVRSARTDRLVARIEHEWTWLDTASGRAVPFPEEARRAYLALNDAGGGTG